MDNLNISQQIPRAAGYQTLGKKVFWLFFLQTSPAAFIILLISIVIFILSFQPFLANTPLGNVQSNALTASFIVFMISVIIFAISLGLAWLNYINYTFLMADDSFKIKRGIFSKTENAIPYCQIQNVDVERSLFFQMLGLSRLIILTAGHEDEKVKDSDEAEGVIPAIDSKLATWMQTELLKKADIQKMVNVDVPNA
ncbi:MAG: PH domain-containing protein [Candidatus Staskawiczbacteria bacterium]|jgi:uncharacterized membrane protein YdbT with pleckstrin-like domain